MTDIQTVLGPVPHDQLGLTLAHEHLFVNSAGMRQHYPWQHLLGPLREMCFALPEANETINFGIPWFRAGKGPFGNFGVEDDRPRIAS